MVLNISERCESPWWAFWYLTPLNTHFFERTIQKNLLPCQQCSNIPNVQRSSHCLYLVTEDLAYGWSHWATEYLIWLYDYGCKQPLNLETTLETGQVVEHSHYQRAVICDCNNARMVGSAEPRTLSNLIEAWKSMALRCAISIPSCKALHPSLICMRQDNTAPRKQAFLMLS